VPNLERIAFIDFVRLKEEKPPAQNQRWWISATAVGGFQPRNTLIVDSHRYVCSLPRRD
jgi:hypothetical protein